MGNYQPQAGVYQGAAQYVRQNQVKPGKAGDEV